MGGIGRIGARDWFAAARTGIASLFDTTDTNDWSVERPQGVVPAFVEGALTGIRPLPAKDFTVKLTRDDAAFYAENGFVALERITTDEELEWLREVYAALMSMPVTGMPDGVFDFSQPYGAVGKVSVGQILRPERFLPQIRETVMWRNARFIAAQLLELPENAIHSWGHLIFKPAHSPAETPWHQDEAYASRSKQYDAVTSWLPLDNVDEHNGCLWYVPGSQREEIYRHRHAGGDPKVHALEIDDDTVNLSTARPVRLPAGGMTFHHPHVLHYSGGNTTDHVRRSWTNQFITDPVQRARPKRYPWHVAGRRARKETRALLQKED